MKTYAFALTKFGNKLAIGLGSFSKLRLDGRLSLDNAMLSSISSALYSPLLKSVHLNVMNPTLDFSFM